MPSRPLGQIILSYCHDFGELPWGTNYSVTNTLSNLTTGFAPCGWFDRWGRSKVREHCNVVRLLVGSRLDRSYTVPGVSITRIRPLGSLPWASGYWGPNTSLISLVTFVPLIIVPYWLVPRPMFVPKRRSQQGVVGLRAVTTLSLLLETSRFIGPTHSLLVNYISRDQYVTSCAGFLVPSYMHFRHILFYTSYIIIIGFLVPSSFVPLSLYTNPIFTHYS